MQTINYQRAWVPCVPDGSHQVPKVITSDRSAHVPFAVRGDGGAHPKDPQGCPHSDANTISRRNALTAASATTLATAAGTTFLASPCYADSPGPPPQEKTKLREAKMVMRVTALRGSVPVSWVQEFSTAMEGYGIVAMTQKTQVLDIWHELKGEIDKAKGKKSRKSKKEPKPTTVDAVTLGDAWLGAAIAQGLIQPVPDAKEHRYWVRTQKEYIN